MGAKCAPVLVHLDISHYLIEVQWHHAVKIGFACKNKTLLNDTDDDDCGCAGWWWLTLYVRSRFT